MSSVVLENIRNVAKINHFDWWEIIAF
jgi:hypothetical protein